jgi:hypothetical protein
VPQDEVAITEITPPFVPGVANMELVVENPLQPAGSVQEYVVPGTVVTLYVAVSPGQNNEFPEITLG